MLYPLEIKEPAFEAGCLKEAKNFLNYYPLQVEYWFLVLYFSLSLSLVSNSYYIQFKKVRQCQVKNKGQ